MKVINYLIAILIAMTLFACSSNPEPVQAEPVEEVQTLPEQAHAAALAAGEAYRVKDYELALSKYNEAIGLFNQAAPTAAATDSIPKQILKLQMNIAKIHNDFAFDLTTQSNFDSALQQYESSINIYKQVQPLSAVKDSIDAKLTILYLNTAVCSKEAGEFEKALTYYDLYLSKNPDDDNAILAKYKIYSENLKNEALALENLQAYAIGKNDYTSCYRLGKIYSDKKDYPNAIQWYEKARSIKPDVNVLKELGNIYRTVNPKQYAKSNEVLETVLQGFLSPEDTKLIYKLVGDNYKNLSNKPKAVEYWSKYLDLEFNEGIALYITSYYFDKKNNGQTISYANQVLAKNPANSDALLLRGIAKYNTKDMKGAKADFEKIQNDPKNGKNAQQYLKIIK